MSDLISRKALLETERLLMTDVVKNNPVAKYILEQILFDIEHASTAFDKKKVIEELREELRLSDEEKERCAKENPIQFDSAKGYANGMANAIEIVEKGGIE